MSSAPIIRRATHDDMPALLGMGQRFATSARLTDHVGYSAESAEATLAHLIDAPLGILLVTDRVDAMIGGLAYPHPFNRDVLVGQELFWWSEGRDGPALLDAIEAEAKALGVAWMMMLAMENLRPSAVGRTLQRRGYRPLEHTYLKGL